MYERACDLTKPASRRSDLRTRYTGHVVVTPPCTVQGEIGRGGWSDVSLREGRSISMIDTFSFLALNTSEVQQVHVVITCDQNTTDSCLDTTKLAISK
jgi:hypothetical protein